MTAGWCGGTGGAEMNWVNRMETSGPGIERGVRFFRPPLISIGSAEGSGSEGCARRWGYWARARSGLAR